MIKILKVLLVIGASMLLTSCGIVKSTQNETANTVIDTVKDLYPEDNVLEEMLEAKIESVTGIDLDLTPSSPEIK